MTIEFLYCLQLYIYFFFFCISVIKVSGLMVVTLTHAIEKDLWYAHGLME